MKICLLIVLITCFFSTFVQAKELPGYVDSLKAELQKTEGVDDKEKQLLLYKELGYYYHNDSIDYTLSLHYLQLSYDGFKKLNNRKQLADLLRYFGNVYYGKGMMPESIDYYKQSLKANEELGSEGEVASMYNNLGICYTILGNYYLANTNYNKGAAICEVINKKRLLMQIYQNSGIAYSEKGDYKKAIELNLDALRIAEELEDTTGLFDLNICIAQLYNDNDEWGKGLEYCLEAKQYQSHDDNFSKQAAFFNTLGEIYCDTLPDSAQVCFEKVVSISLQNDFKRGLASGYAGLASIYENAGQLNKAIDYHKLSLAIEKSIDNFYGTVQSLFQLASTYYLIKDFDKAINFLNEAEGLCIGNELLDLLDDVYKLKFTIYKATDNSAKALKYHELFVALNDSILNIEVKEHITTLEIQYQTERKEQQIKLLKASDEVREGRIKLQRSIIFGFVVLLILIGVIAFIAIRNSKMRITTMGLELQNYLMKIKELEWQNVQFEEKDTINLDEIAGQNRLTEREIEILKLIANGLCNKSISGKLFISNNTVKYHIKNIYLKLDIKNRFEAIRLVKCI